MTKNFKKTTLSLTASAVLVGNAFALDPAITNFGYIQGDSLSLFDMSDPSKVKNIGIVGNSVGIAPTGNSIISTNGTTGEISKINPYTGATSTIATVSVDMNDEGDYDAIGAITGKDGRYVYISNSSKNRVEIIDTDTNTVTNSVVVGTQPYGMVLSPDGSKLYVAHIGSGLVNVIDTTTNTITANITVGWTPRGIATSPDGSKVYTVAPDRGSYYAINTSTNGVTTTGIAYFPISIAVSPDGSKLYITDQVKDKLYVVDSSTNTVIQTLTDIDGAWNVQTSPDGSKIYVTSIYNNTLTVIDSNTYVKSTYTLTANTRSSMPFISPNLLTGTLEASSSAELEAKGFTNYVNFAGGTLKATGSFTLTNPVYLHDAFNITWDDSSTFTTVAGGTVDTNGYDVEFSGEVSGVGGLTKTGTGVLTLSGTNTYSGGTTVTAGTLRGTTSSLQGDILNNAIVEFAQSTNGAFADVISGSGELVKSGSGVVTLSGTNTYTGDTTINAGTLAITGDTTTSDFIVNSGGVLRGSGSVGTTTVKSEATLYPTGTNTLNVSGDLTFESGSIYRLDAKSNGTSGKVVVTGAANLDGTVQVKADSSGTWNETTDYEILSATTVNGTFDSVSSDLAFLDPTLSYEANKVNLTLTRNSTTYSTVANNSVSKSVGSVLDNVTSPNADMQNLITTLNGMNSTQAQTALTQLAGTPLASTATSIPTAIQSSFSSGIASRFASLRSDSLGLGGLAFVDAGDMYSTYKMLKDEGLANENGLIVPQDKYFSMWSRVIGSKTKTNSDGIRASSDVLTKGLQIGVDKNSEDLVFGVSYAYLSSDTSFSNNEAASDTNSHILGLYADKSIGAWGIKPTLSLSKNSTDANRDTPTGTASSDANSYGLNFDLDIGYEFDVSNDLLIEPSLLAGVAYFKQNGYSESGAGGSNLSIKSYSATTYNLGAGVKATKLFKENDKILGSLELSLGYKREFGDTNKPLSASFSAAPSAGSFSINGVETGKNSFNANVLGIYNVDKKVELFASLGGYTKSKQDNYTGILGIKYKY